MARVQGVSPFLFTFRLVAFNYASYPALSMPYGPAWTCSSGVARSSCVRETSPFRVHRAPGTVRFCCRADPPGPPACAEPLASWRGDFPQCLALSATLLLPRVSHGPVHQEPLGPRYWRFSHHKLRKPSCASYPSRAHGRCRGPQEGSRN